MSSLTIFLLDDNEAFLHGFQQHLTEWLKENVSGTYETFCFNDAAAMLQAAETRQADLLISDIDLGGDIPSGIDAAAQLLKLWPGCAVIYLTAYLSYATDVYETAPIYFILKDEYDTRIPKAMKRFFQYWMAQQRYVSIISGSATVAIPLKQLIYCERVGRTVHFYLDDGRDFPSILSIKEIYELLPKEQFSICHRGFIVNHSFISSTKRLELTLSTGQTLPVGRSCCDSFRENYSRWLTNFL